MEVIKIIILITLRNISNEFKMAIEQVIIKINKVIGIDFKNMKSNNFRNFVLLDLKEG